MTKLVYVVGRTDGKPTLHGNAWLMETPAEFLRYFVTTLDIKAAKKFPSELVAMRFLSRCSPVAEADNISGIVGYELLLLDFTATQQALARGRTPGALAGGPYAIRVFCSTHASPKPSGEAP